MSLKNLELIYDRSKDKWVWFDVRTDSIYVDNVKRASTKILSKGFYPLNWNFVLNKRGNSVQCSYCGLFMAANESTRDHIVPKSKGGVFTTSACKPCNDLKKDTMPIAWAIEASESGLAFGEKHHLSEVLVLLTKAE